MQLKISNLEVREAWKINSASFKDKEFPKRKKIIATLLILELKDSSHLQWLQGLLQHLLQQETEVVIFKLIGPFLSKIK